MKLNHLSLAVPQVVETAVFLEKFFGFITRENKGNIIIVMEGAEGFVLVLTTKKQEDSPYPADFHFGFLLPDEAGVLAKYEELLTGGHDLPRPPAKIRGNLGFYFHAPGGVMMEVSSNL
jgi:catechol 2,3-dioxygenase-like lactoylglutathione lyase family enzyme